MEDLISGTMFNNVHKRYGIIQTLVLDLIRSLNT